MKASTALFENYSIRNYYNSPVWLESPGEESVWVVLAALRFTEQWLFEKMNTFITLTKLKRNSGRTMIEGIQFMLGTNSCLRVGCVIENMKLLFCCIMQWEIFPVLRASVPGNWVHPWQVRELFQLLSFSLTYIYTQDKYSRKVGLFGHVNIYELYCISFHQITKFQNRWYLQTAEITFF